MRLMDEAVVLILLTLSAWGVAILIWNPSQARRLVAFLGEIFRHLILAGDCFVILACIGAFFLAYLVARKTW